MSNNNSTVLLVSTQSALSFPPQHFFELHATFSLMDPHFRFLHRHLYYLCLSLFPFSYSPLSHSLSRSPSSLSAQQLRLGTLWEMLPPLNECPQTPECVAGQKFLPLGAECFQRKQERERFRWVRGHETWKKGETQETTEGAYLALGWWWRQRQKKTKNYRHHHLLVLGSQTFAARGGKSEGKPRTVAQVVGLPSSKGP